DGILPGPEAPIHAVDPVGSANQAAYAAGRGSRAIQRDEPAEHPVDVLRTVQLMAKSPHPGNLEHRITGELVFNAEVRAIDVGVAEAGEHYAGQERGVGVVGIPATNVAGKSIIGGSGRTVANVGGWTCISRSRPILGAED